MRTTIDQPESRSPRMRRKSQEHQDQVALFRWAAARSATLPELKLLFAIPNGGQRNIIVASRMKAEGVRRGVPDIMLPIPRQGWHGLFIELKAGKNKVTREQESWIDALLDQDYYATVCYGWEEASNLLLRYLGVMTRDLTAVSTLGGEIP